MDDDETGWVDDPPCTSLGAIYQLTTIPIKRLPKKHPIGFQMQPSTRHGKGEK